MPRRVLLISYTFPPTGGAGVQRVAKFAKYLPEYGWEVSVLTAANPSVPLRDDSLVADVPATTRVCRARTWEPSYAAKAAVAGAGRGGSAVRRAGAAVARRVARSVLQPDAQTLWMPHALREGNRLLAEVAHDAVLVSGPPFSAFLTGARLARRHDLPLVVDYRDEWTISNTYLENRRVGPVARALNGFLERRVLRAAKAVLATTRASAAALAATRDRAGGQAEVHALYNGFDTADFPSSAAGRVREPDGRLRVVYVGTLWNLTDVSPLVAAVEKLTDHDSAAAAKVELAFVGRRTEAQDRVLDRLRSLPCRVTSEPYVDHHRVPGLLASADALCVLLSAVGGADRVMPAKVFEYMAARRPVLAIAPRGEVWDVLRPHPDRHLFEPADVGGIAGCLQGLIRRTEGRPLPPVPEWDTRAYERGHQAGRLADLLDRLLAPRPAPVAARPAGADVVPAVA